MKKELLKEAITKIVVGIILIGLLLFIPAGTLSWLYGWIFMGMLFVPMLIAGIVMYFKAPDLLESRLRAKETQSEQKQVIGFSGIMFLLVFILAGLNYRFKWIILPEIAVYIGIAIFLLSYALFGEVLRENRYLSRVIEVQKDQKVVDSGLYGIVRHPMYFATLFLFLSMPLVLNSLPSFIVMLSYIPIIVKRIRNEEEVLEKELSGYKEYKRKVRYRLIPFMY
ncbi:MAG: isoprenylcysteine carboxylmethyltransferase family protein [Butyrivibrio sp.]|nr:isoprenylcysteine carboxylmethyltransferase family protein [Butyrivibrio sp.]MBQ4219437.1 isoprenylcysteine carboxylmethyltransferase family protein [Butyrivibrio sp.]MEE3470238.1 isoprenylcysteine carboxylmethyltransferase family protein [Butyrivibrio hungatei]MEE3496836.1 isoprenylcysteine carboxylmethyltransferase family protein [Butyrivibrio sp.]